MLFINIKMKCHTFVWWVFQRYLCFSFILGWFVCVRWFSFLKDSPMFSHHWKCYLQIDNQYYRKIAFHFVKKAFRLRENVRRIFLLEWNFVCVYQIIKVVEFSQCIPTHTIRYPIQIIPKTIQSKAICWDKWVWIFWRELTKMTNDSVSPNVKYEFKCRVRRWIGVCVILDFCFVRLCFVRR